MPVRVQEAKVYFHETDQNGRNRKRLAGLLKRSPNGKGSSFTYDSDYIAEGGRPLSISLPVREQPYVSEEGLPSYFDNLASADWLRKIQAKVIEADEDDKFTLLSSFGHDLSGAVSIEKPYSTLEPLPNTNDPIELLLLSQKFSISGVNPKIVVKKDADGHFRPTEEDEISTHIAKMPRKGHANIIPIEYVCTKAMAALLPEDQTHNVEIGTLKGHKEPILFIERFDRKDNGTSVSRSHFEEINQAFDHKADDLTEGDYATLGKSVSELTNDPADKKRIYKRILANILIGNYDTHLKNFGVLHDEQGHTKLAANYDIVSTEPYREGKGQTREYRELCLSIGDAKSLNITKFKTKHAMQMGLSNGLSPEDIADCMTELYNDIPKAIEVLEGIDSGVLNSRARNLIVHNMIARWNFALQPTGKQLVGKHGVDPSRVAYQQISQRHKQDDAVPMPDGERIPYRLGASKVRRTAITGTAPKVNQQPV